MPLISNKPINKDVLTKILVIGCGFIFFLVYIVYIHLRNKSYKGIFITTNECTSNGLICSIDPYDDDIIHHVKFHTFDWSGFPIPGTSIDIPLRFSVDDNNMVTLTIPQFNFQISGYSSPLNEYVGNEPVYIGYGTLGFYGDVIPKTLRPIRDTTVLVASNDVSIVFYVEEIPYNTLGSFSVLINTYGQIFISSPDTASNLLTAGPHSITSTTITYKRGITALSSIVIPNFIIQPNVTNISGFTSQLPNGIRDSQVNDAFEDLIVYSWTDNSAQIDKTNNLIDAYVCIGRIVNGAVVLGTPINLTNLAQYNNNDYAWDTAVAINRTDSNNIVVSFMHQVTGRSFPCVCVSIDKGITFSPMIVVDESITTYDNRGILADKYGNFWYNVNVVLGEAEYVDETDIINHSIYATNMAIYMSSDKGFTWSLAYNTTDGQPETGWYDYPQMTLGNDGQGNYGIWFMADFISTLEGSYIIYTSLGFIPITALGEYGEGSNIILTNTPNMVSVGDLTVKDDGTVFILSPAPYILGPSLLLTKEPGVLSESLVVGPKVITNVNNKLALPTTSWPTDNLNYFPGTVHGIIYDDYRQVLYCMLNDRYNPLGENFNMFMVISFDEGNTWSDKINIANTSMNNRGFLSAALNPTDNSMALGWYDSRNDLNDVNIQYFGAYLSPFMLDTIVDIARNTM